MKFLSPSFSLARARGPYHLAVDLDNVRIRHGPAWLCLDCGSRGRPAEACTSKSDDVTSARCSQTGTSESSYHLVKDYRKGIGDGYCDPWSCVRRVCVYPAAVLYSSNVS